jgi:hypothetical protein
MSSGGPLSISSVALDVALYLDLLLDRTAAASPDNASPLAGRTTQSRGIAAQRTVASPSGNSIMTTTAPLPQLHSQNCITVATGPCPVPNTGALLPNACRSSVAALLLAAVVHLATCQPADKFPPRETDELMCGDMRMSRIHRNSSPVLIRHGQQKLSPHPVIGEFFISSYSTGIILQCII